MSGRGGDTVVLRVHEPNDYSKKVRVPQCRSNTCMNPKGAPAVQGSSRL